MFSNNEQLTTNIHDKSSLSPKRSNIDLLNDNGKNVSQNDHPLPLFQSRFSPFKTDAKQYMDKVLNLMTIINEVDDVTNVAELKNKLQMQKCHLLKARVERDEHISNFNKVL
jgi:hypothetical protein